MFYTFKFYYSSSCLWWFIILFQIRCESIKMRLSYPLKTSSASPWFWCLSVAALTLHLQSLSVLGFHCHRKHDHSADILLQVLENIYNIGLSYEEMTVKLSDFVKSYSKFLNWCRAENKHWNLGGSYKFSHQNSD